MLDFGLTGKKYHVYLFTAESWIREKFLCIFFNSLDEVAAYDVSRSIDYVLEQTQQKSLTFIGYSMGTTVSYMLLSSKPEYNEKINLLISVTPVVHFLDPADMIQSSMLNGILVSIHHIW